MEVINILVFDMGMLETCKSFIVIDENRKEKIVESAEDFFIQKIKELDDTINKDDEYNYIEDGYYTDTVSGKEIFLVWSE